MADVKPFAVKATDDIFGILALTHGAGTMADILKIKGATRTPIAKSSSVALDGSGDIAAKTVHGAAVTMFDATSEFMLNSGTLDLSELFLGQTATAGTFITAISIKTSNTGNPTISFTGKVGMTLQDSPSGYLNKWALPAIEIVGKQMAQIFGGGGAGGLGFTAEADCKTTGSGLDFTVTFNEEPDGEGLPCAFSIRGADGTMNADFVAYADLDAYLQPWTLDTAAGYLWTNIANPDTAKVPTEYWTGSASATIADPATALPRTADA